MRETEFRGKTKDGRWIFGDKVHINGDVFIFPVEGNPFSNDNFPDEFEVIPETVDQFTGKFLIKGNKLFENDIVFSEIEEETGDKRIFFICKWIHELCIFTFLTESELFDYDDIGIDSFDRVLLETYNLEDSHKYHYSGNYHDNPELLENFS